MNNLLAIPSFVFLAMMAVQCKFAITDDRVTGYEYSRACKELGMEPAKLELSEVPEAIEFLRRHDVKVVWIEEPIKITFEDYDLKVKLMNPGEERRNRTNITRYGLCKVAGGDGLMPIKSHLISLPSTLSTNAGLLNPLSGSLPATSGFILTSNFADPNASGKTTLSGLRDKKAKEDGHYTTSSAKTVNETTNVSVPKFTNADQRPSKAHSGYKKTSSRHKRPKNDRTRYYGSSSDDSD